MIDVEKLAREAGMNTSLYNYGAGSMVFTMGIEGLARGALERFAAIVLEQAAMECENHQDGLNMMGGHFVTCSAAIRALKPK